MVSSLSHIQPVRYSEGFFQNLFNIFANLDVGAAIITAIDIKRFTELTTIFNRSTFKQLAVIFADGVGNLTIVKGPGRDNSFVNVRVSLISRVRVIFRLANTFQYNLFSDSLYFLTDTIEILRLYKRNCNKGEKKTRRLRISINKVISPISIISFVSN
jgi:hypothetical protein